MESFPEGVLDKSLEYVEGKLYAGEPQVAQIIGAINVYDIKVVAVAPASWPSLIVPERIAAILEAVIPAAHLGVSHAERVALTEMGSVIGVRDAAVIAAATAVAGNGPCLLPGGLLRLGALRRRLLCLLGRGFLGALRLCFLYALGLCFLRVLRRCFLFVLGCRFLCVLRLLLVLRRLRFLAAAALFLFAFLC